MVKIPRNKPCPCGSGKKYKKCCLKKDRYSEKLPDDALNRLKEEFSKYNQEDLIKTLAALSICPENQSQYIRLETAAQIACSNNNCGDRIITISELNELFLKYLPSDGPIGSLEDPLDNLFTNNILFFKNNVIFTGSSTSEYYVLQNILNSIHFNSSSFSKEFLNYFYQNSKFILTLSDHIAKISGHERYEFYDNRFRQEIFIPNMEKLESLKKSVSLKIKQLKEFKDSLNILKDTGKDFIIEVGNDKLNNIFSVEKEFESFLDKTIVYSSCLDNNPLLTSPLIKIGDKYIIFPTLLSISLRHNILSNIIKFNEKDNFIKNYQNNLWSNILFNLKNKLHFEKYPYKLPKWENTIFKDGIFKIDTDKLAYCILINDNLKNYDENEPCKKIDLKYKSKLKNRINTVISNLNSNESINDILIILFVGMSGRQYYTNLPENTNLLTINCEEFDIITKTGHYDSLTLLKFAKLLEKTDIIGESFLDKFSVYLERKHSFYMDDKKSDLIFLTFDSTSINTKELRKNAIHDNDSHFEKFNDKLILVNKVNEFMYVTEFNLFLIKIHNQNIWIIDFKTNIESTIAEAIGYWIWQFSDELKIDLKSLNNHEIFISATLEEYEDLDLNIEITPKIKENLITSTHVTEEKIELKISKYLLLIAKQENNDADRLLMNEILKLIGILLEKNGFENTLTEEHICEIINKKAPAGLKKYILIYTSENIMNIPVKKQIRLLQYHNVQLIMDNLVNKVKCEYDYNQKLTKDESLKLSHQIVDYLLDCIKEEIVKYDWEDLIQKLILNYENILFNRSYNSFTDVYTLNSYDNPSNILEDIINENKELSHIDLPTKILIEILSAEQNFNSKLKISNEDFDNLMALSFNYINWGINSDYIHSQHVDFEITPLESGRVGTKTNLEPIFDTLRTNRTLEHMHNPHTNIFHENDSVENPNDEENEAFESEFGINLTEYCYFISTLINLAIHNEKDIVLIPKSKLVEVLIDDLEWSSEKSLLAIENFSLAYRENWETPPEGYDKNDIYPWVFRRPLSYDLKPLIIKNDDDETIIYGFRNVYYSGLNLISLIYKGLYKSKSSKINSFKSKMTNKKGKEFNNKVFKWLKDNLEPSRYYLKLNENISKIIKNNKYGDIDILLLDKSNKVLFSIECKDTESAKNPRQINQEINNFFGKKGWVKKHQRRDEWIKNNLDKLGERIGYDLKDYKVISIFIVSQELPVIYLKKSPIDIIPFSQIKNEWPNFLDKYK